MSEQMTFFHIELPPVPPRKSVYQKWKFENKYRKAENKEKRCKNCIHRFTRYRQRYYHKCLLLGLSGSQATDITLSSVCDNFEMTAKNIKE